VGRQASDRQRSDRGTRAGNRDHGDPLLARSGDQVETRIAHQRRACVADQRDRVALCKSCNELRALRSFVVFVQRRQRGADPAGLQHLAGVARILRRDQRDAREHLAGARREIAQVADRRCDDVEGAGHGEIL
jgi:hypothetical protein